MCSDLFLLSHSRAALVSRLLDDAPRANVVSLAPSCTRNVHTETYIMYTCLHTLRSTRTGTDVRLRGANDFARRPRFRPTRVREFYRSRTRFAGRSAQLFLFPSSLLAVFTCLLASPSPLFLAETFLAASALLLRRSNAIYCHRYTRSIIRFYFCEFVTRVYARTVANQLDNRDFGYFFPL